MSDDILQKAVQEAAEKLGVALNFDPDADLSRFRNTKDVLHVTDLQQGLIVWAYYKKFGEEGPRVNGAYRLGLPIVAPNGQTSWGLSDGSSFGLDFDETKALNDEDGWCRDFDYGAMYLYRAEEVRDDS